MTVRSHSVCMETESLFKKNVRNEHIFHQNVLNSCQTIYFNLASVLKLNLLKNNYNGKKTKHTSIGNTYIKCCVEKTTGLKSELSVVH